MLSMGLCKLTDCAPCCSARLACICYRRRMTAPSSMPTAQHVHPSSAENRISCLPETATTCLTITTSHVPDDHPVAWPWALLAGSMRSPFKADCAGAMGDLRKRNGDDGALFTSASACDASVGLLGRSREGEFLPLLISQLLPLLVSPAGSVSRPAHCEMSGQRLSGIGGGALMTNLRPIGNYTCPFFCTPPPSICAGR